MNLSDVLGWAHSLLKPSPVTGLDLGLGWACWIGKPKAQVLMVQ